LISNNEVPQDHIFLLLNESATLDTIRSVLGTKIRQKAGVNDTVIIYYAGHGATEEDASSPDGDGLEKYLLPYNSDPSDLYSTALPMREIETIFNRISSERLIFIGDTCYSGASGGRTFGISGRRATLNEAFIERLTKGKGRVILTASRANELSLEDKSIKHGVFTYYLLEALRGKGDFDKDGYVTLDEAYKYLFIKVPEVTGQKQHPVMKGEIEGIIYLGKIKNSL
jgi:uncharacterized caspase-like protein